MTEQLIISRLGHRGDGVADTPDGAVYVPYTLPGETVTVEHVAGHPDRRHLLHVDKSSHERATPICKHFGTCGGCALQHWSLAEYHLWKRSLVAGALAQAGIVAPVADLIDAHGAGRRRAVFHARRGTHDVLEVGFTAPRAHHIVPIDDCPILAPGLAGAVRAAWAIAEVLKSAGKPLDIQVTATDSGLDIDVRGSGTVAAERLTALAKVAETHEARTAHAPRRTGGAAHTTVVARRTRRRAVASRRFPPGDRRRRRSAGAPRDRACRQGPPRRRSFHRDRHVCVRLAENARVAASDSEPAAIKALQQAAGKASGLKPIDAQTRDLFRRPFMASELKNFDVVVFDPPRQGAEAQARELGKSAVPVIVAVSCDANTFARDAKILVNAGYTLVSATPVDQFRYSYHVEIVAKFTR